MGSCWSLNTPLVNEGAQETIDHPSRLVHGAGERSHPKKPRRFPRRREGASAAIRSGGTRWSIPLTRAASAHPSPHSGRGARGRLGAALLQLAVLFASGFCAQYDDPRSLARASAGGRSIPGARHMSCFRLEVTMNRTRAMLAASLANLAIFASGVHAQSGACCLDGGACFGGTPASCASAFPPGAYQGDGSSCATALCGQQGACCFPDGTCQDSFWGPCDSSTGTFQGDGSSCTPNVCPPPAPVPTQINHQGIVSVNGQRYTGNGQFYFAIIDPATGNSVWTNDATNVGTANRPNRPVVLPCVSGLYSVRLGDQSLPNMKLVPVGAFSSENRSLRIWFNDGTNGVHQLTPDHVLTSGPYAMRAPSSSSVPNTIVFTSSGVWTKPLALRYAEVELVGGGGNGAGGPASNDAAGAGGGSAGYSRKLIGAAFLSTTEVVTVGDPTQASSFGSHLFAEGGGNGGGGTPGTGGIATGGDVNVSGQPGGRVDDSATEQIAGDGADSVLGLGGKARSTVGVGGPATGYGAGGAGSEATAGNPNGGGAGAPGIVIVKEFF